MRLPGYTPENLDLNDLQKLTENLIILWVFKGGGGSIFWV